MLEFSQLIPYNIRLVFHLLLKATPCKPDFSMYNALIRNNWKYNAMICIEFFKLKYINMEENKKQ